MFKTLDEALGTVIYCVAPWPMAGELELDGQKPFQPEPFYENDYFISDPALSLAGQRPRSEGGRLCTCISVPTFACAINLLLGRHPEVVSLATGDS